MIDDVKVIIMIKMIMIAMMMMIPMMMIMMMMLIMITVMSDNLLFLSDQRQDNTRASENDSFKYTPIL